MIQRLSVNRFWFNVLLGCTDSPFRSDSETTVTIGFVLVIDFELLKHDDRQVSISALKETKQFVILLTQSLPHSRFNTTPNG